MLGESAKNRVGYYSYYSSYRRYVGFEERVLPSVQEKRR